jgi:hypothetical protein
MKTIIKTSCTFAVCTLLALAALTVPGQAKADTKEEPLIQMAILLDTSNSMDGLINQARSEIWKIVNEFALAKRNGVRPRLEVALYEYGNDGIKDEGWVRQVLPLTNDLDKVSEELFALRTLGGSEYCGQVIRSAVAELKWSRSNKDLKVIFIAGNEPFDQGKIDYRGSCKNAIKKGIMVNTIHCGNQQEGVRTHWKDGAMLADGRYMHIDQNKAVAHIAAPQDKRIAELGAEMNQTYIPYGAGGQVAVARQAAEDSNASSASPSAMTQRAIFKSGYHYRNDSWDLVDAVKNKSVELDDVDEEQLPEEMKKMDSDQRAKHVKKTLKRREELQVEIQKLNDDRKVFVASKRKELQESKGEKTLDSVMIEAVHEQGAKRNFDFK